MHVEESTVLVNRAANGKQTFVNLGAFNNVLFSLPALRIAPGTGQARGVC